MSFLLNQREFLSQEKKALYERLQKLTFKSEEEVLQLARQGGHRLMQVIDSQTKVELVIVQANPAAPEERKIKLTLPCWFFQYIQEEARTYILEEIMLPLVYEDPVKREAFRQKLIFACAPCVCGEE